MSVKHPTVVYLPIEGFPDYLVGTDGTVVSSKYKVPRVIKGQCGKNSYFKVSLYCGNGKANGYQRLVHRLVLETFIGNQPEGMEACHENGNSKDNRLANLRWDTRANNALDRIVHGTSGRGELNTRARLTMADVNDMKIDRANGMTLKQLAEKYGIVFQHVSAIVNGKCWDY